MPLLALYLTTAVFSAVSFRKRRFQSRIIERKPDRLETVWYEVLLYSTTTADFFPGRLLHSFINSSSLLVYIHKH